MSALSTLRNMLTFCRPAGSTTESAFIAKYIATLPDAYRCFGDSWIVQVDDAPILFSCHTDTVHRLPGMQTITESAGIVTLSKRALAAGRNCLGADDTAGVWLCREMILARVPGTYIFHFAEERGGIGSRALADNTVGSEWLKRFTHAIAFDRRGTRDVITHQACGRSASDAAAQSIADMLTAAGLPGYLPCDAGIFTDTANYTDIIGECTNVSVGYDREHTRTESLDLQHADRLRCALIAADWRMLVSARLPGEDDPDSFDWLEYDDDALPIDADVYPDIASEAVSWRLDPEFDRVQHQLTIDLLKYRANRP